MQKIKNKDLAQLLLQLRFTPHQKRRKQLDAAERLFAIIEREREYPFEFVFFRITGFHHKGPAAQELIRGDQLLDDLRNFIAGLSGQVAPPAAEQSEKVYSIQELAGELGISARTLRRWRKRGLIARKFIYQDGVKRFGFLKSTVDNFLKANPDLGAHAKKSSRLTPKEKRRLIKRAATLAAKPNLSRHSVISRIAAEIGRSHEMVRYTLANYEKANPGKPLFKRPAGVTSIAEAVEIYRLFKQNSGVKDLMKRFGRSRSSIYRIIKSRRAKELLARKVEFIASDEFLSPDARDRILGTPLSNIAPAVGEAIDPFGLADGSLEDYLRTLKKTPVVNRECELELFRRYNYLKYIARITTAGMKPMRVSSSQLDEIEGYLAEAEDIQRTIIEANLRLVVSIARKHTRSGANLPDLISEGNVALMRAIEKFDYSRGFRFATFASWTIAKDFARRPPGRTARRDKETAASLARMRQDVREEETADLDAIERAHQSLAQVITDELDQREKYVILNRFGPIGQPIKKKTKTLGQIGEELGLSKERVRQIELLALQKLRQSLSPKEFELLTR
jgi:RNA polymerase sigma factor (sigma-70 family)